MKKLVLFAAVAAALAVTGCSNDPQTYRRVPQPDRSVAGFSVSIVGQQREAAITRASGTEWHTEDKIGIYAMHSGATTLDDAQHSNVMHRYHSAIGGGTHRFVTGGETIFFPIDGTVDFVAYYPYKSDLTAQHTFDIDITSQSTLTGQALFDVLHATTSGHSGADDTPGLQFNHMLSKVSFTVTDLDKKELAGSEILFKGLNTTGTYSVAEAEFSGVATPSTEGFAPYVSGTNYEEGVISTITFEAIIFPGATNEWTISIRQRNGDSATIRVPAKTYLQGKVHTYTANIKDPEVTDTESTASETGINDWATAPGEETPTELDDVVKEPGTPINDGSSPDTAFGVAELFAAMVEGALTDIWAGGTIVGAWNGSQIETENFTVTDNVVLADNASETDLAKCLVVELTDQEPGVVSLGARGRAQRSVTTMKQALNLKNNPDLFGKAVKVEGTPEVKEGKVTMAAKAHVGGNTIITNPDAEVTITTPSPIEIAATSDIHTIEYDLVNAPEGDVAAACDAAWISDFDASVAGEISFVVEANVASARSAVVRISFPGIAEQKTVTVAQAAGESDPVYTELVTASMVAIAGSNTSYTVYSETIDGVGFSAYGSGNSNWGWNKTLTAQSLGDYTAAAAELGVSTGTHFATTSPIADLGRITATWSGTKEGPMQLGLAYSVDGTAWAKHSDMVSCTTEGTQAFTMETPLASGYYVLIGTGAQNLQGFSVKYETVSF